MHIKKRTLPIYVLLNCLTLGIYGFIEASRMNREIDALCRGDKQTPGMSYGVAWLFSKIPGFGTIYYDYRWYQQANRLKLNANRYGLTIKESGTDIYLMRTVGNFAMVLITVFEILGALLVPALFSLLIAMANPMMGFVLFCLFIATMLIFVNELSAGANMANYFIMKNLNRFADVYRNGATEFDPMAYEYYPCAANNYPALLNNEKKVVLEPEDKEDDAHTVSTGSLIGLKGSCAGYRFDLISGEEIILGKDAKFASVVIDPAYKEVSRKHVSICYDMVTDQYRVIDYSSNGTWANGSKLVSGQVTYLSHGAELKLANDKNIFMLG